MPTAPGHDTEPLKTSRPPLSTTVPLRATRPRHRRLEPRIFSSRGHAIWLVVTPASRRGLRLRDLTVGLSSQPQPGTAQTSECLEGRPRGTRRLEQATTSRRRRTSWTLSCLTSRRRSRPCAPPPGPLQALRRADLRPHHRHMVGLAEHRAVGQAEVPMDPAHLCASILHTGGAADGPRRDRQAQGDRA